MWPLNESVTQSPTAALLVRPLPQRPKNNPHSREKRGVITCQGIEESRVVSLVLLDSNGDKGRYLRDTASKGRSCGGSPNLQVASLHPRSSRPPHSAGRFE
ncbi:hypothetical protein E2C01_002679 [Portunus trituberculatus]|uniref:Uncharacterized protein n=1 Tax=Portunus trituberculatus TaxID=210409 RepID=A0A5B7CMT5_PORTR|nr:hypothetical protein [Portunus trituberculatus]